MIKKTTTIEDIVTHNYQNDSFCHMTITIQASSRKIALILLFSRLNTFSDQSGPHARSTWQAVDRKQQTTFHV
jgi:hypothetical protein